jgi:hypothetical protein
MNNVEKTVYERFLAICMPKTSVPAYQPIIKVYRQRYDRMATAKCKQELRNYTKTVLHDPIEGLDWKQLLDWVHRHFVYTKGELPSPRAETPIDIILQAKGMCREFAMLYNGLLLANGYRSRIVIDCSILKDKSKRMAGDHVWNEILIDGTWTHVDPTEKRIDQPSMYALEWRKDVNLVYAITEKEILDVTENYSPKSNVRFQPTQQ